MSSAIIDACARIRAEVALSSVIGVRVKLIRAGREWKACCPFHPDRSPSFTIFDDDRRYHCFGCGADGDVLDFVQRSERVGLVDAIRIIDSGLLPVQQRSDAHDGRQDRGREAMQIWQNAVPPAGTEAEKYLASRCLTGAIPPVLRFARLTYGKRGPQHPVLVALVVDVAGQPTGIQRTYLAADGRRKLAVDKPKLSLGKVRGGAIRLAPARNQIVITEGMEDALTLQRLAGLPAWAAAGAGMMPSMALPRDVRSVIIGADADEAGQHSARKACAELVETGRSVRIITPDPPHKDFNAEWCAQNGGAA